MFGTYCTLGTHLLGHVQYSQRQNIVDVFAGFPVPDQRVWDTVPNWASQLIHSSRCDKAILSDLSRLAARIHCQGCGSADATLKMGIEKSIREMIPEVGEILDTTDHAAGRNPYYQPSK